LDDLERCKLNGIIQCLIEDWIKRLERDYRADQKISIDDAKKLREDIKNIQDLMLRELVLRPIFEVADTSAFDKDGLLDISEGKSSSIFDKDVWEKLPQIAKSDFSDTAKCLLVKASTPASMVALRGMEAVVREYYSSKTGQPYEKKVLGTMIRELRSLQLTNTKILDNIDYLRSEKRNFAQHPNQVFNQREAERIYMAVISMVHDIYADMT
jgi:hypothetical protein